VLKAESLKQLHPHKPKTELMHTTNVEKSEVDRATDSQGQQLESAWIMTQHTKKKKTLDLKWNLGFWQQNAGGGKEKRKRQEGEVGGGKKKYDLKHELLN
jgi:hypothetical protein